MQAAVIGDIGAAGRGPGAGVFLRVEGAGSRRIRLFGNDLSEARRAFVTAPGVSAGAIVPSR